MSRFAVFFLHGYGSTSQVMREFVGTHLVDLLPPECKRVFLDAPMDTPSGGKAWFDLEWYYPGLDLRLLPASISNRALKDFFQAIGQADIDITQKANELSISTDKICLFGFSQGAMVSLGLAARRRFAGVVSYAGAYLDIKNREPFATKNVMLVHGSKDEVVPVRSMHVIKEEIELRGVVPVIHEDLTSAHMISNNTLQPIADFIKKALL